ncbi:MAG: HEPN domain-containing protein [Gammaproteobacteria bacterium]
MSLKHLPEIKQANIRWIVDVIHDEFEQVRGFASGKKKHCRIVLIILFGSYATGEWIDEPYDGYVSDYDILVVLNHPELLEAYEIWGGAEERIQRKLRAPISLIVHTHEEVNERLQQGHYFFRDIQTEGICLYQYQGATLAKPGVLSATEAREIAQEHYTHWFESADSFLINYGHCMDRKDYKIASFMLHQATERYYACFLLVFTNYLPRTHNLKLLNSLSIQQNKVIATVFPQDKKYNRRLFELLKHAYIGSRYSKHFHIVEEELLWLQAQVEQLQKLTQKLCLQRIASLNE